MNVINGTPGQNGNITGGFNDQTVQNVQGPQQGMYNTQQPNFTKQNGQMGAMQQQGLNQGFGGMQQQNNGYQQGYGQQPMGGNMGGVGLGYGAGIGGNMYSQPVYPVKSTIGLIGMIMSILSLICCGPILAIPGAICSIIALIKHKGDKRGIIGIIAAIISMVLWIVLWFTGLVSLNSLSLTDFDGNKYDIIEDSDDDYIYEDESEDKSKDDYYYNDENTENNNDYIIEEDNKNSEAGKDKGNVGTDVATTFHPSSVVYNGIKLDMGGYTASELEDVLGYEFSDDDMKYVLNPGYYYYTTYWVEKDPYDRIIYFYFVNDTDEAIPMSECTLFRINFYSADYFNGDKLADWCNVDLGKDITLNSTWAEIENILGEPDYVYENEDYDTYKVEYYKIYDYEYRVEFDYKDGKMTELSIGFY